MTRSRERGSAVVIVMIVIGAALAAGVLLTSLHTRESHASDVTHKTSAGLYCAEAGVSAAQSTVAANHAFWDAFLGNGMEPGWLSTINHDIDGNGSPDFQITLRDNDDDVPNDLSHDTDHAVFLVSTCIKNPENRAQVSVLLTDTGERRLWLQTE